MRVSNAGALGQYLRPLAAQQAVVARRSERSLASADSAEPIARVAISEAASTYAAHLEQAGEGHGVDGCETCAGFHKAASEQQASAAIGKLARRAGSAPTELSDEDRAKVDELEKRDAEVRRHEQAHMAAAGGHANGGPTYEFERGPDGKQYAVGGHVNIDTSPVSGDPEATLRKAETIRRAALAPSEPSGQDQRVAAKASAMAADARRELATEGNEAGAGARGADRDPATRVIASAGAIASYTAHAGAAVA